MASMFNAWLLMGAACLVAPTVASAQAAPAGGDDHNRVEEVVVTARRTEERLQTTPVAVTALTARVLEQAQILDVNGVQRSAPNLVISTRTPNSSAYAFLGIRGQTNFGGTISNDPAIGVYVDGVYVARTSGSLLDLIDIERVEVLRGPQGTLFGRNTTGGALNIISREPSDQFSGSMQVEAGNYEHRKITGVLSGPLAGNLSGRLVYQHSEHDGYARNVVLNTDLNDLKSDFVRFALRYEGENWDATLTGDYTKRTDSGTLVVIRAANSAFAPLTNFVMANPPDENGPGPADDSLAPYFHSKDAWYTGYANVKEFSSVEVEGYALTVNADLGAVDMKSITAWRSSYSKATRDLDGSPYQLIANIGLFNQQEQVSQEVQFTGGTDRLDWIGGLFFFTEKGTEQTVAPSYLAGGVASRNFYDGKNTSYAGYLQASYKLTDQLRLTAGARYTYDERGVVLRNETNVLTGACALTPAERDGGTATSRCISTRKTDFNYVSYTAGADYQLSGGAFLYLKTSHASLAGGWNPRFGSAPAFSPESVTDVEAGGKFDWMDGRLRTNLALFHMWQKDVQRTSTGLLVTGQTTSFIRNAAEGTVYGAELEVVATPWRGMTVNGSLGLMKAKYDSFTDLLAGGVVVDRSAEDYPQAPEATFSIGATQRIPTADGEWTLHADYAWTDDHVISAAGTAPNAAQAPLYALRNALAVSPAHGLLNARIAYTFSQPDIEVAIWGRNLTKTRYWARTQSDFLTSLGFASGYPGDPRVYGVSLTYRFGS